MASVLPSYDETVQGDPNNPSLNPAYPPQSYAATSSAAPYPPAPAPGASYQTGAPSATNAPYPTQNTQAYQTKGSYGQAMNPRPDQYQPPPPPSVHVPQTGGPSSGSTVIVTQPTVVIPMQPYSYGPSTVRCPRCQQMTTTRVEFVTGGGTWVACAITALVGCWCGCCLIPFCMDGLKDAYHYCSECGQQIGVRKRM